MLKTDPVFEVPLLQSMMRSGDRYWNGVLLPVSAGVFLVDIDWAENGFDRIQSVICPATRAGVMSMHSYEAAIHALLYIAAPNHDGAPRDPPVPVDAIGIGNNAKDKFREVLIVRTLDGTWHACAESVDLDKLDERTTLLVVDKGEPEVDAAQRTL